MAAAAAIAPETSAQGDSVSRGQTHVLRIYADAEGNSHVEELTIAPGPDGKPRSGLSLPITSALIRESSASGVAD